MATYYVNEAVLDLPERSFVDKTIHALEARLPGGEQLAVFVHRRPIQGGQTLRELVDESVALNTKRLSAFAVLDEAPAAVGGRPGVLLAARWRLGGTTYFQRQAHVAFEGALIVVAVTTPLAERAACDEAFDGILRTITWRTDGPPRPLSRA